MLADAHIFEQISTHTFKNLSRFLNVADLIDFLNGDNDQLC